MKFGAIDINSKMGLLSWKNFKAYYDENLLGKVKEQAEEVYELLGGKPPKKNKKEGVD